mmetsp:Transcript_47307/g.94324  ORF Transcript_47307/g.94324 Transcript_47307/m.94324 type:complete len:266 (-) Transcript_47307:322-1119(-)|eukprot:CAMPEP_0174762138 /NCGR_PEP_ID=MMETSP1094-20130205/109627_1 /TAXON_ID=156173 /ORGANISM="Chrysochromulina brevifilum, Strain UTEX LB 985" /LENGTH=265 /DNA_ID=CAMNT_0015968089 /DNA_START=44 /DNA_END=841 /DNA_ORIENTATION=-
MMPAARGTSFRQINFSRGARAYDQSAIPQEALAAKKEVKVMRVPDLLGDRPAGWNASTMSDNMSRFPDRAMMRQLSKYDSHKRADYNFRAEQLDDRATTTYIPRPSKLQTNERAFDVPRLQQPHHISRCEFPVHSALEGKPRWDPATGHGGDPHGVQKAQLKVLERERVEALEYSKRHPPKERNETLTQREARFMREQREQKKALRETSTAPPSAPLTGTWSGGNTGLGYSFAAGTAPPLNAGDSDLLAHQVPVRKQTTWSLGGF